MKMTTSVIAGLILAATLSTSSNAQSVSGTQAVPEGTWKKSDGNFSAIIFISDKPSQVMAEWKQSPIPPVQRLTDVKRNVPIVAFVAFSGCMPASDGNCKGTIDFQFNSPTELFFDHPDIELCNNLPAPPEGVLQLSSSNQPLLIEAQDPPGRYSISARVKDLTADKSIEVRATFTVSE